MGSLVCVIELMCFFTLCSIYSYTSQLTDWKQKNLGNTEAMVERTLTLEAAKGQALAGRGLCFLEKGQLKEALRDLHLSLQILPGTLLSCLLSSEQKDANIQT